MLLSMLNSHPRVFADSEIFRELNGRDETDILKGIFTRQPVFLQAVGFKLFFSHPLDTKDSKLWTLLKEMEDLRVIHLKRNDLIKVVVSREIALKTRKWVYHISKYEQEALSLSEKRITIDCKNAEEIINQIETWNGSCSELFPEHPLLVVTYEDLVQRTSSEFKRITDFLELSYVRPKTHYVKQNPEPLSDLVNNYDEFRSYFNKTKWAPFFLNLLE
jgi:hypothetical protein